MNITRRPERASPPQIHGRAMRFFWEVTWLLLARFSPTPLHGWRRLLLRLFGAKLGTKTVIYSSAKIWAPWNLVMESGACLGRGVVCYNVAKIIVEKDAIVSQRAYLCSAGHDIYDRSFPLVAGPIEIGRSAWVAAEAFIGPGVSVHEGAVVAARSVCVKSVPAWTIVGGNPAAKIGERHTSQAK